VTSAQFFMLIGNIYIAAGMIVTGLRGKPSMAVFCSVGGLLFVAMGYFAKTLGWESP